MKVKVTEKCSTALYRKIYYKGHYAGRKAEGRSTARRVALLDGIWQHRLQEVRDTWQKAYLKLDEDATLKIRRYLVFCLLYCTILGQLLTCAVYLWGHGGF